MKYPVCNLAVLGTLAWYLIKSGWQWQLFGEETTPRAIKEMQ